MASTPKADPFLGRTLLNQYIIKHMLGKGGFGSVYEAYQPSMERKVAVKTLHPHLTSHPDIVARFRREGLAASRLSHPAAVKMHNFGETEDGVLWMAMEFLEGESLERYISRQGALPPGEAVEILGPVCEVLAESHQKGITHRDLKPDNIMLTPFPGKKFLPKVLDFGIAGILDHVDGATRTGMVSGTPQYMSPEQWKGLKFVDHRSDIYALGIIAYQCLSGRLPFEADTAPAWMSKHCLEAPLDLQKATRDRPIPSPLTRTIMKALAKNPDERYQSALDFKRALEEALAGKSPQAALSPAEMPSAPTLPFSTPEATRPSLQIKPQAAHPLPVQAEEPKPKQERGFFFNLSLGKFRIAFGIALALLLLVATRDLLRPPPSRAQKERAPQGSAPAPALEVATASPSPAAPSSLPGAGYGASSQRIVLAQVDTTSGRRTDSFGDDLTSPAGAKAEKKISRMMPSDKNKADIAPEISDTKASEEPRQASADSFTVVGGTPPPAQSPSPPETGEGLPPEVVAALKSCLGPVGKIALEKEGDYRLSLTFSSDGQLTSVHLEGKKSSADLKGCLLSELRAQPNFTPTGGKSGTVTFTFSLPPPKK